MRLSEQQKTGIGMTSQRTRDRLIQRLVEQGINRISVLDAIRSTPRHLFVDEAMAHRAYEDTALPIGSGQTISQPYVVARMTEVILADGIPDKVLEVGTGSGYQTAILAQLVPEVLTVERIKALLQQARFRFKQLRLRNIRTRHSDGSWGWPNAGPYDAIVVTAAPGEVPDQLLEQLAPGGRMVIPVGESGAQELKVIRRTDQGFDTEVLEMVSFVPLLDGVS
ncbi:MAG: protein-L-isoaspartate(D-aspartate) O-methyltransferase [Gammaproteobacteria bacterium]|nr:MAG: protein-L-isoaspartate(D-aspartate) O-methyltransferase [Gammaproteobacteria bacterium]